MNACDTPTGIACKAIRDLYAEHAAGGYLHIVTDDLNVGDSSLAFCRDSMEARALEHEPTASEWAALAALEVLSRTARMKACTTWHDQRWLAPADRSEFYQP